MGFSCQFHHHGAKISGYKFKDFMIKRAFTIFGLGPYGLFYWHGSTGIIALESNRIHNLSWDVITNQPNHRWSYTWMNKYISLFYVNEIT